MHSDVAVEASQSLVARHEAHSFTLAALRQNLDLIAADFAERKPMYPSIHIFFLRGAM